MTNLNNQALEIAMERMGIWVADEINKGWTTDMVTGEKLRMKKDEWEVKKEKQQIVLDEVIEELEQEEMDAQDADMAEIIVHSGEDKFTIDLAKEDGTTIILKQHVLTVKTPPKLVPINCQECGAERIIKVQDLFQVKFCQQCQKVYRNARRRELRKINKEINGAE